MASGAHIMWRSAVMDIDGLSRFARFADGAVHVVAIVGVESMGPLSESIVGILQQIILIFDGI